MVNSPNNEMIKELVRLNGFKDVTISVEIEKRYCEIEVIQSYDEFKHEYTFKFREVTII